jgi:PKHD-type hydroxylase
MDIQYWLWDKALSKDFCKYVINDCDWEKSTQGGIVQNNGVIVNLQTRITDVIWKESMSVIGCVAKTYIDYANKQADWNFNIDFIEQIQLGKYEKCGHYDWHTDSSRNKVLRKLSFSALLNDPKDFEGGDFEIKNIGKIKMEQGSILVFPSYIEHRVTPIISGVRYSAVTWAKGPAFV